MKLNQNNFVDYLNKKLLSRLFILANSKLQGDCLLAFDRNADKGFSKKFYHLLLECFENWGKNYARIAKYKESRMKLLAEKKIPVVEKFYNYPPEIDENNHINEEVNVEDADYLELKKQYEELKKLREEVTKNLIDNPSVNLNKKKQINTIMNFYEEEVDKIKSSPLYEKHLNNPNPKTESLVVDINNELFYHSDLIGEYKKADNYDNTIKFYQNLKELNTNYFNGRIDTNSPIYQLRQDKEEEEKMKKEEEKIQKQKEESEKFQKAEKEVGKNFYEMNLPEEDDPSFVDDDEKNMYDYNMDLEKSVEFLENKKRKLETNINKLEKSQKENLTPKKEYQGLEKVLKKKENQIEDLEEKISHIEKEFKNIKDPEDYEFEFARRTPYKVNGARDLKFEERSKHRSVSLVKSKYENSDYKLPNNNPSRNKYENSGTKFVNKMYDDINKLLNKNQNNGYRYKNY